MREGQYIALLSQAGDQYGNLLLEFLEACGLYGLKDATAEQLRDFCAAKGLLEGGKN